MVDDDGIEWESVNTYSPVKGVVYLGTHAPTKGSYTTVDPMGFVWSMTPRKPDKSVLFASKQITPLTIHLDLEVDGEIIDTVSLIRRRVSPDVKRIEVRDEGLFGTLFVPGDASSAPGIIHLSGSEGGVSETRAASLASHGYVSFALAYFGFEYLPETLTNIPLEYFETAIQYLRQQEWVDPNKIGVIGSSRGGELSLLLGATYPDIRCVVGYVPSIYRNPGAEGPAWTLRGKPLPFLSASGDAQIMADIQKKISAGEAVRFTPWFESVVRDRDSIREAEIAVEKINGPIMLISGQDDQLWPSALFSDYVVQRLKAHNFKHDVVHVSYPDAGHFISIPFKPTTVTEAAHPVMGIKFQTGGTPAGNAHASSDSWSKLLLFLESSFQ